MGAIFAGITNAILFKAQGFFSFLGLGAAAPAVQLAVLGVGALFLLGIAGLVIYHTFGFLKPTNGKGKKAKSKGAPAAQASSPKRKSAKKSTKKNNRKNNQDDSHDEEQSFKSEDEQEKPNNSKQSVQEKQLRPKQEQEEPRQQAQQAEQEPKKELEKSPRSGKFVKPLASTKEIQFSEQSAITINAQNQDKSGQKSLLESTQIESTQKSDDEENNWKDESREQSQRFDLTSDEEGAKPRSRVASIDENTAQATLAPAGLGVRLPPLESSGDTIGISMLDSPGERETPPVVHHNAAVSSSENRRTSISIPDNFPTPLFSSSSMQVSSSNSTEPRPLTPPVFSNEHVVLLARQHEDEDLFLTQASNLRVPSRGYSPQSLSPLSSPDMRAVDPEALSTMPPLTLSNSMPVSLSTPQVQTPPLEKEKVFVLDFARLFPGVVVSRLKLLDFAPFESAFDKEYGDKQKQFAFIEAQNKWTICSEKGEYKGIRSYDFALKEPLALKDKEKLASFENLFKDEKIGRPFRAQIIPFIERVLAKGHKVAIIGAVLCPEIILAGLKAAGFTDVLRKQCTIVSGYPKLHVPKPESALITTVCTMLKKDSKDILFMREADASALSPCTDCREYFASAHHAQGVAFAISETNAFFGLTQEPVSSSVPATASPLSLESKTSHVFGRETKYLPETKQPALTSSELVSSIPQKEMAPIYSLPTAAAVLMPETKSAPLTTAVSSVTTKKLLVVDFRVMQPLLSDLDIHFDFVPHYTLGAKFRYKNDSWRTLKPNSHEEEGVKEPLTSQVFAAMAQSIREKYVGTSTSQVTQYQSLQKQMIEIIRLFLVKGHKVLIMENTEFPERITKVLLDRQFLSEVELGQCIIIAGNHYAKPPEASKHRDEYIETGLAVLKHEQSIVIDYNDIFVISSDDSRDSQKVAAVRSFGAQVIVVTQSIYKNSEGVLQQANAFLETDVESSAKTRVAFSG